MKFATAIFILLFAGCSHLTLTRGESALTSAEPKEFQLDSFLLGAIPASKPLVESEVRGKSRIETINMFMTGTDVATSLATIGIYVPHRVIITCARELN